MKNLSYFLFFAIITGCGCISCKGDAPKESSYQGIIETKKGRSEISDITYENTGSIDTSTSSVDANQKGAKINSDQYKITAKSEETPKTQLQEGDSKLKGKITFEEMEYNFGRIPQGKVINKKFKFTNTGKAPLNIKNASSSCGCTAPSFPFTPIEPGKTGFIEVNFSSVDKMGMQRQNVHILTDGNPAKVTLRLKGVIVPRSDANSSSE